MKQSAAGNIVVIGLYYYDFIHKAYSRLDQLDRCAIVRPTSGIYRLVKKAALSHELRKFFELPGALREAVVRAEMAKVDFSATDYVILFESPEAMSGEYAKYIKERYKIPCCLIMLNPLSKRLEEDLLRVSNYYDHIITCNQEDALKRAGWSYYPSCYSADIRFNSVRPINDLCLICEDKGRGKRAIEIYNKAVKYGVSCDFVIVNPSRETRKTAPSGIELRGKPMPYEECIARTLKSNCLLELVLDNKEYATLRTMEAVVYGRKLLTTNSAIRKCAYFDKDNMRTIHQNNDVDCDFIKSSFVGKPNKQAFSVDDLIDYIDGLIL